MNIEFDFEPTFKWRLEQLKDAGFDDFPAFRLAANDVDWHQAADLLRAGATQQQVLDLLLPD